MAPASNGLVGRDPEIEAGRRLLQAVAGGAARSLFVEGEAGVGKTGLVDALVAIAADAGLAVLRGGAHPLDEQRPFGVVAEALDLRSRSDDPRRAAIGRLILSDDGPEGAARAGGTDVRYRVVAEIVDLVESLCAGSPLLLALEDLHWADEASIAAFASLRHALHHVPLLLVGTLRPDPRPPRLRVLLDDCVAHGAHLVRLRPLDDAAVAALVRDRLGDGPGPVLAAIVDKAGGNPLWITEILGALSAEGWLRADGGLVDAVADELPGSFRELVLRRLGYLPPTALELLQLTSVLGDVVSLQDLGSATGRTRTDLLADLEEAFRSKLLDEREDGVAFRHQLLQQAIYEDLPRAKRRAMHREAADVFARAGADPATVAGHLLRGADAGDVEAVDLLRRAAAESASSAPAVAVELLGLAASLLPAGHEQVDLVASQRADALLQAGQVADAAAVAERVVDRPHREEVTVPLSLTLVSALSLLNRPADLIQRAESVLDSAPLDLAQQALVLTQASYGRTFSGDFVGGEATARRAVEVADRAGDTAMAVWSRCALTVAVRPQGRYADALALAEEAVRRTFEPADPDARLRHPHFFLGMALADSDRLEEARVAYRRAVEEAEELGAGWLLPDMVHLSGEAHLLAGGWDDASTEFEAGLKLTHEHGQRISIAQTRGYQALIATGRGDLEVARTALADVDSELRSDPPAYGAEIAAYATAVLAEADGDQTRAFDVLLRSWALDVPRDVRYYHRYLGPALVRLALVRGASDVAAEVTAAVEAGALLAPEVPTVQSASLRCRGLLTRDPAPLVDAVEQARLGGRLLDHAGACEDAAEVLGAAGRTREATELLLEALERYDRVDARAWAARVSASLRSLGVRQGVRGGRRRPATGWDSLTDSERAVAELVAGGLTNREVARQLHVSPHTINTHLRHVFQKLTVTTRTQLAATVLRSGDHASE